MIRVYRLPVSIVLLIASLLLVGCERWQPPRQSAPPTLQIRYSEVTPPPAGTMTAAVPVVATSPAATLTLTPTPFPFDLIDALPFMQGICYESAYDARGRVFVIRSNAELQQLYDAADNSELCRQPVKRYPLELPEGAVMAGLWSYGMGCTADHTVLGRQRDDATSTVTITVRFVTMGACNYELVRPFWVIIPDVGSDAVVIERVP